MRHRCEFPEKMARALELHEKGVDSYAIGQRLGMSSQQAARTIVEAKARRAKMVPLISEERTHD